MKDMTAAQYFESMLVESLGSPNVKKRGSFWPPVGEHQVQFGAVDTEPDEHDNFPCFINTENGKGIKVPYTINRSQRQDLLGKEYEYVFWFSNPVGAEISLDTLCKLTGTPRPKFESTTAGNVILKMATMLNGLEASLVRKSRTLDNGKIVANDQWFLIGEERPLTKPLSSPPEPAPDTLDDDEEAPF